MEDKDFKISTLLFPTKLTAGIMLKILFYNYVDMSYHDLKNQF